MDYSSLKQGEYITHLTHFFTESLCGFKKLDKRDLTYNLSQVTCAACLEKSRLEAIENQRALDTLPKCPQCGARPEYVTLAFTVTKLYRLDVQTERDWNTQTIKPLIYGSDSDTLDTELIPDKEWQVTCENGHEFFTKRLEPIEDGTQWFVKDVPESESHKLTVCGVCGGEGEHDWEVHEHDWEVHNAELRADQ